MTISKDRLAKLMRLDQFPRSAKYDPEWVLQNAMGPHPLWLTEWLCQGMDLQPGMRVLDMGCGKAITSIFLAREFGVQVWATDLWVNPTENWKRICDTGLQDRIFPIHAEARSLPYAETFFDAIVCVDNYMYYGTDDLYLNYFVKFVKPNGKIGIVEPGLMQEFKGPVPEHIKPFWSPDCWAWHTAEWWRHLWARTGFVNVEVAEPMPDGWKVWMRAEEVYHAFKNPESYEAGDIGEAKILQEDRGRYMGFIRMIATRKPQ